MEPRETRTTAHADRFVIDRLPPTELQPGFVFDLPELHFPARLNASALLDRVVSTGRADRTAVVWNGGSWTYGALLEMVCRIAGYLRTRRRLVPGNRVMLIGPNSPMLLAAWWGVLRAGGIAVTTNPLLRAGELLPIIDKAAVSHALVDAAVSAEFGLANERLPAPLRVDYFNDDGEFASGLEPASAASAPVPTASTDPALIAFTSGTTGQPKGCVHYHRDVIAMAETFSRHILRPGERDVFCGTPPFAFTYGLGASVVFPAACGAATAIPDGAGVEPLLDAIVRHRVTTLFTAPTAYRGMLNVPPSALASLRTCVSAGEHLPEATSGDWFERTGVRLIDGIGATEMMHIFISAAGDDIRPGATGRPVPGYVARIVDEQMRELPDGEVGRLAVRGPTGCRYLADERQKSYVREGWNLTGDLFRRDEDGYFWYVSRSDDMIISSGYNIAAPEVENALLLHADVAEAAVVGVPDDERGQICRAFVVLRDPTAADDGKKLELQRHVKATIAPYKYPREIVFVDALPKTHTGKLQRFALRDIRKSGVR